MRTRAAALFRAASLARASFKRGEGFEREFGVDHHETVGSPGRRMTQSGRGLFDSVY